MHICAFLEKDMYQTKKPKENHTKLKTIKAFNLHFKLIAAER